VERAEQALVVLRNLLVLVHLSLGNAVCGPRPLSRDRERRVTLPVLLIELERTRY
jgi:hypothetical protein